MCGETWIAEEFKWAGFNLVTLANNHVVDYGVEGLLAGIAALDDIRLAYAGAGQDLWMARQPGYLETKKGRAAMVASTSAGLHLDTHLWYYNVLHTAATATGNGVPGRPGVNPLRHDIIYTVPPQQFADFQKINEQWGQASTVKLPPYHPVVDREEINFLGSRIVAGDTPGIQYIPLKQDVEGNLRSIRNAKRNAALVIASHHTHERDPLLERQYGTTAERWTASAEYIRQYAKDCLDAGADVYYGSGSHTGQGIEIYKGKPIFYSLANPIVSRENLKRLPLEEYERYNVEYEATISDWIYARWIHGGANDRMDEWFVKTVVATFTMHDGELTELTLHPVDASAGEPWVEGKSGFIHRGVRPVIAKGQDAKTIIERYAKLSEPFGTEITYQNGVGIVKT
jgi:poly-gamma-glutamate synthesis protein (capsule biosynthesis protein)